MGGISDENAQRSTRLRRGFGVAGAHRSRRSANEGRTSNSESFREQASNSKCFIERLALGVER